MALFQKPRHRRFEVVPTVDGGFIVHVECQQIAFSNVEKLIIALNEYLIKPEEIEKEYREVIMGDQPSAATTNYGLSENRMPKHPMPPTGERR